MPTSAGKTLVAELLLLRAVLCDGAGVNAKALLILPYKVIKQ